MVDRPDSLPCRKRFRPCHWPILRCMSCGHAACMRPIAVPMIGRSRCSCSCVASKPALHGCISLHTPRRLWCLATPVGAAPLFTCTSLGAAPTSLPHTSHSEWTEALFTRTTSGVAAQRHYDHAVTSRSGTVQPCCGGAFANFPPPPTPRELPHKRMLWRWRM